MACPVVGQAMNRIKRGYPRASFCVEPRTGTDGHDWDGRRSV